VRRRGCLWAGPKEPSTGIGRGRRCRRSTPTPRAITSE
jgi:hypothetical protein